MSPHPHVLCKRYDLRDSKPYKPTATQAILSDEGPEGVKWQLRFAYFWLGKWDFMHWDWDSSAKK